MKKLIFIIPALLIFFSSFQQVQAQAAVEDYDQAIMANPISLLFGWFNAAYEVQVTTNNSLVVNGYYFSLFDYWTAFGVGASFRWYFDAFNTGVTPIEGLGVGPLVRLEFWTYDDAGGPFAYDGGTGISIGGEAVYKWVWGGFVLEPGLNVTFGVADVEGLGDISPVGAQLAIGYAW